MALFNQPTDQLFVFRVHNLDRRFIYQPPHRHRQCQCEPCRRHPSVTLRRPCTAQRVPPPGKGTHCRTSRFAAPCPHTNTSSPGPARCSSKTAQPYPGIPPLSQPPYVPITTAMHAHRGCPRFPRPYVLASHACLQRNVVFGCTHHTRPVQPRFLTFGLFLVNFKPLRHARPQRVLLPSQRPQSAPPSQCPHTTTTSPGPARCSSKTAQPYPASRPSARPRTYPLRRPCMRTEGAPAQSPTAANGRQHATRHCPPQSARQHAASRRFHTLQTARQTSRRSNSQQPATSNQQPATSNPQPATSNQQPAPSNHQPPTGVSSQQPTANSHSRYSRSQQPANCKQPIANSQRPAPNSRSQQQAFQQPQPSSISHQPTASSHSHSRSRQP